MPSRLTRPAAAYAHLAESYTGGRPRSAPLPASVTGGSRERAIATFESECGPISQQALDEADRLLDEAGLAASVAAEPSSPVDDPQSALRLGPCDQSRTRMGHSGPVAPASRPSAVISSQSRCSASAT